MPYDGAVERQPTTLELDIVNGADLFFAFLVVTAVLAFAVSLVFFYLWLKEKRGQADDA